VFNRGGSCGLIGQNEISKNVMLLGPCGGSNQNVRIRDHVAGCWLDLLFIAGTGKMSDPLTLFPLSLPYLRFLSGIRGDT